MAYDPNELFSEENQPALLLCAPEHSKGVKIATHAGNDLLAAGTPMFEDAGAGWRVWVVGAVIEGFLLRECQTNSVLDKLAPVMLRGRISYASIVLPAGQTEANLKAALREGPLARGLIVTELDGVR